MPGKNNHVIVIADSDALIALLNENDALFIQAKKTAEYLIDQNAQIIFPATTIAETITTFTRKLHEPKLAQKLIYNLQRSPMLIEKVDAEIIHAALKIFQPSVSKQNTLFDAIVVATCDQFETKLIFSFDKWYAKLGYVLVPNLIAKI